MSQSDDQLRVAVAAGVLRDEATHRELLASIAQVARAIFHARAASVLLLDEATSELVFEAVVGEGEDTLIGRRFASGTGVAGWVLATGQPLILTDVSTDPRFSAETAQSTGYVPQGIMAVPLIHGEDPIGVLEVLDRPANSQFSLDEVELLGLFGAQAAAALALLRRARLAGGGAGRQRPGARGPGRRSPRGSPAAREPPRPASSCSRWTPCSDGSGDHAVAPASAPVSPVRHSRSAAATSTPSANRWCPANTGIPNTPRPKNRSRLSGVRMPTKIGVR